MFLLFIVKKKIVFNLKNTTYNEFPTEFRDL